MSEQQTSTRNDESQAQPALTSGGLLARNVVWNLLSQSAPMAAAIFTIPVLIAGIGTDRFGVLTLAWMVLGYFSLFDLGLGRRADQDGGREVGAGTGR